jgi:hypothetical protein
VGGYSCCQRPSSLGPSCYSIVRFALRNVFRLISFFLCFVQLALSSFRPLPLAILSLRLNRLSQLLCSNAEHAKQSSTFGPETVHFCSFRCERFAPKSCLLQSNTIANRPLNIHIHSRLLQRDLCRLTSQLSSSALALLPLLFCCICFSSLPSLF